MRTGEGLEEFVHTIMTSPYPYGMGAEGSSWPKSFIFFSTDIIFTQLPEWELIRILDANGHLLASPYGRIEDALPTSAEGSAGAASRSRNGGKPSRSRISPSWSIAVRSFRTGSWFRSSRSAGR